MRKPTLVLALALAGALASFTTSAQVIDATPCQSACDEQQSECIEACGAHDDPMECEGRCQDQFQDCLSECG